MICFILGLVRNCYSGSTFRLYKDQSPDMTTNSLKLINSIKFYQKEINCVISCEKDSNCDLVKIETLFCDMYTMFKNYTLTKITDTKLYVKYASSLLLMNNKVIGKFLI